jgi:hypothetical protein
VTNAMLENRNDIIHQLFGDSATNKAMRTGKGNQTSRDLLVNLLGPQYICGSRLRGNPKIRSPRGWWNADPGLGWGGGG